MAQTQGLRTLKIPEAGRWVGPFFKPVGGWCDFMLIDQNGKTAFIDTKTTDGDNFNYALINRSQITFLQAVGDLCPAGYIVYFRGSIQRVIYYQWNVLAKVQPKSSLHPVHGIDLGPLNGFNIKKIFLAPRPRL